MQRQTEPHHGDAPTRADHHGQPTEGCNVSLKLPAAAGVVSVALVVAALLVLLV